MTLTLENVDIFVIDEMVLFELNSDGDYDISEVISIQLNYLENCDMTSKSKLIKIYRHMNYSENLTDEQILKNLKNLINEGFIYDYIIIGEDFIKNY